MDMGWHGCLISTTQPHVWRETSLDGLIPLQTTQWRLTVPVTPWLDQVDMIEPACCLSISCLPLPQLTLDLASLSPCPNLSIVRPSPATCCTRINSPYCETWPHIIEEATQCQVKQVAGSEKDPARSMPTPGPRISWLLPHALPEPE